jgi:hypothetical protein
MVKSQAKKTALRGGLGKPLLVGSGFVCLTDNTGVQGCQ